MGKAEVKLNLWMPADMLEELETIATKRGLSKAEASRMLLSLGLEVHRDLSRVGVVRLADMIFNLKTALRDLPQDDLGPLKT